jgi:hypothetical protein
MSQGVCLSFSEILLKRGVHDENALHKQKGCDKLLYDKWNVPHKYLYANGVLQMYRVRARTPFLQGLQLGLHPAMPKGNLLLVALRSQCDGGAA